MTRTQYKLHRRNIRDNGLHYTLARASDSDSITLTKLYILAGMEDFLARRAAWIAQSDTTRANVIRLTSPLL